MKMKNNNNQHIPNCKREYKFSQQFGTPVIRLGVVWQKATSFFIHSHIFPTQM